MKKMKIFGLAAVAIVLICGLGLVGCDDGGGGGGGGGTTTYTVTVTKGYVGTEGTLTTGQFAKDATVTIRAEEPVDGDVAFKGWETTSAGVVLTNSKAATTTFTMPANAVNIEATYGPAFLVTVEGGTSSGGNASGKFAEGTTVTITATVPEGKYFDAWTTEDGVVFANASSPTTTFTMLGEAVTVTATFFELYEAGIFTSHPWGAENNEDGIEWLCDDDGLLAIGYGPKSKPAVWALMTRDNTLVLNQDTVRTNRFAIMNKGTGNFINIKGISAVTSANKASAEQVKVSSFENTGEFWWDFSGRSGGAFVNSALNIYNVDAEGEVVGMLAWLDGDKRPSENTSTYYGVYLCYSTSGDWNTWLENKDETPGSGDESALFSMDFPGQKFDIRAITWPLTYTVNVVYSSIDGTATAFEEGDSVTVKADVDKVITDLGGEVTWWEFKGWESDEIDIADVEEEEYTFLMPPKDITITAIWENISLARLVEIVDGFFLDAKDPEDPIDPTDPATYVVSSNSSRYFSPDDDVFVIRRDEILPGNWDSRKYTIFDNWKKWVSTNITIPNADETNVIFSFKMPELDKGESVTVTAQFDTEKFYSYARSGIEATYLRDDMSIGNGMLGYDGTYLAAGPENNVSSPNDFYWLSREERNTSAGKAPIMQAKGRKFALYNDKTNKFVSRTGLTAVNWDDGATASQLILVDPIDGTTGEFVDDDDLYWYLAGQWYGGDHPGSSNVVAVDETTGKVTGFWSLMHGTSGTPYVTGPSAQTATLYGVYYVTVPAGTTEGSWKWDTWWSDITWNNDNDQDTRIPDGLIQKGVRFGVLWYD